MMDITDFDGDIVMANTDVPKAENLLSVQLGALEYAPDFGIDLKYFLKDGIRFQNESFRAYLVERLANRGINLASVTTEFETLYASYIFELAPQENSTGLVAR